MISLLEEQEGIDRKGGTMRLGSYDSQVFENTNLFKAYKKSVISERHRHRYEFNNFYKDAFAKNGLIISCVTDNSLVEAVEWSDHPFGVGVQFHPEFKSKPFSAQPIFREFVKACIIHNEKK